MKVGDIVKGRITNIKPYGAFVKINEELNGLIHISELTDGFVRSVEDFFAVGDVVDVQIIKITEDNKISLSYRNANRHKRRNYAEVKLTEGFKPLARMLPEWVKNYQKGGNE